jgi:hypothetical protein
MKSNNNKDDLKGLCFSVIIIASVALTFAGSFGFPDGSQCNLWQRLAGIPAMITVYLVAHSAPPESRFIGWIGSFLIYAVLGVVILFIIQYWINKKGGGGGGKKGRGPRI